MLLDDSSGVLVEVTCARPTPTLKAPDLDESNLKDMISVKPTTGVTATGRTIDLDGLDIGTVVKVKGGVKTYRGERQMQLERIGKLWHVYSIAIEKSNPGLLSSYRSHHQRRSSRLGREHRLPQRRPEYPVGS